MIVAASALSCGPLGSLVPGARNRRRRKHGSSRFERARRPLTAGASPQSTKVKAQTSRSCRRSPVRALPDELGFDLGEERLRESFELRHGELDPVADAELEHRLAGK